MCYYVSPVFMLMLLIELSSSMSSEVTAEEKLGDILWIVEFFLNSKSDFSFVSHFKMTAHVGSYE